MIKTFRNIKQLEKSWKRLVDSENGPIYLTYEFHKLFYRDYKHRKFYLKSFRHKEAIYVCSAIEDEIAVIAPLLIDHREKSIDFIGTMGSAGYNDFIYGEDVNTEYISDIIDYLKNNYSGYLLELTDMASSSKLSCVASTVFFRHCYKIEINNSYDEWYESLSKKMRQTIRCAYRRMKMDERKMEFVYTDKISFLQSLRFFYIYEKRLLENQEKESSQEINFATKIKKIIGFIPKFFSVPFFSGFNKIERSRIGYLKIDDKIVAFQIGYTEGDGIICPRCGFNSKYSRYSSGLINNAEIIRNQIKDKSKFVFDLSREYHEYKVRMGGVEYDNMQIRIEL